MIYKKQEITRETKNEIHVDIFGFYTFNRPGLALLPYFHF